MQNKLNSETEKKRKLVSTTQAIMDIVQNNESQFNVEELEQRLEMTAAAEESWDDGSIYAGKNKTIDQDGFHWWFG